MIYCRKNDLGKYLGIHDGLDKAIHYVACLDEERIHPGRNELSGDDSLYANCFTYRTLPEDGLIYETHILYADVHMLLSGEETIYIAPVSRLREVERREDDDFIGSDGAFTSMVRMTCEDILIVFPGEAHKVKCASGSPMEVRKLVIKIRMEGAAT